MSISNIALQGVSWLKILPLQLKKLFSPLSQALYLDVTFFTPRSDDGQVALAYLGMNKTRARFWGKRIAGEGCIESSGKRTWVWNVERYLARQNRDCQVLMVETSRLSDMLLRQRGFKLPMWIDLNLDSSKPFAELRKNSKRLQQIGPLIRRHNIGIEISNDPADVNPFIDQMHYPFIGKRHGQTTFFSSRESIHNTFSNSELLFLTHGGQRIAGIFLHYNGGTVTTCYPGAVEGLPEHLDKIWSRIYYYLGLQRAIEKGMSCYSMGGTSPFLSDNITYFKLSFKPYVAESRLPPHFVRMIFRGKDAALTRFLQKHPFVACVDNGVFERHVFVDSAAIDNPEQFDDVFKCIHCQNVDCTTIHVQGDLAKIRTFASRQLPANSFVCTKWDRSGPR